MPCRPSVLVGLIVVAIVALLVGTGHAENATPPHPWSQDQSAPRLPTLFIIGDSTVKNRSDGLLGWGDPIATYFDRTKIHVDNRARGGRSSRTYLMEGLWDRILEVMKSGDFVLMQFGHNDGGSVTEGRARASLEGIGDETQEITDSKTGKMEVVHTYGWYLRKYIADTKAKGAMPIVLSPVPRNMWKDDHTVMRASNDYAKWAAQAADSAGASFIDLNDMVAKRYEEAGPEKVKTLYFVEDHTHTSLAGARLNASVVVEGFKRVKDCPLCRYLVPAADGPFGAPGGPTNATSLKFYFGPGKIDPGYIRVLPTTVYTKELGYGFDLGSEISEVGRTGDQVRVGDYCTSGKPFFFSIDLPEGNYNVTVTLGDRAGESATTVKAESRRLMLETVRTARGKFEALMFTVNIRTSQIASGGQVRLKDRELGALDWDGKLTLEFRNTRPCLRALEIARVDDAITVYVAGDSTVTDQQQEPWAGWGQMLPRFFKPGGVAVANHAESGETLKSFLAEKRLEKILSTIKAGDYLFIQFGHNDMKRGAAYVEPFTGYRKYLKLYIAEAREHRAIPVLVTPMHRRNFDSRGKIINTLGDYPEAMRQTAKEENVLLIDLHAMSKDFYEALGPENSKSAFVDNTHTNEYGAYEFARYIAEAIKKSDLSLAKHVVDALPPPNMAGLKAQRTENKTEQQKSEATPAPRKAQARAGPSAGSNRASLLGPDQAPRL